MNSNTIMLRNSQKNFHLNSQVFLVPPMNFGKAYRESSDSNISHIIELCLILGFTDLIPRKL